MWPSRATFVKTGAQKSGTNHTFKHFELCPHLPFIASFKETLRRAVGRCAGVQAHVPAGSRARLGPGVQTVSLSLSGGRGRKRGTRGVSHATGAHTTPNATTAPLVALLPLHRTGTGVKLVAKLNSVVTGSLSRTV